MMEPMTRFAVLLRGINVGGHNKIAMADLRKLLTGLGYTDVATYVQSGNAVLTSQDDDPGRVTAAIADGISAELGLDIGVQVRTAEQLAHVIEANPMAAATAEPAMFVAVFLTANPTPEAFATLDPAQFATEEFALGDRVLYVWYHDGQAKTKLTADLMDRRLGVKVTARNWRTVTTLRDMAAST